MMDPKAKVRENKLRRMAARQGLVLMKSRSRDPRAIDFEGYMLADAFGNFVVAGGHPFAYSLSIDEVEKELTEAEKGAALAPRDRLKARKRDQPPLPRHTESLSKYAVKPESVAVNLTGHVVKQVRKAAKKTGGGKS